VVFRPMSDRPKTRPRAGQAGDPARDRSPGSVRRVGVRRSSGHPTPVPWRPIFADRNHVPRRKAASCASDRVANEGQDHRGPVMGRADRHGVTRSRFKGVCSRARAGARFSRRSRFVLGARRADEGTSCSPDSITQRHSTRSFQTISTAVTEPTRGPSQADLAPPGEGGGEHETR